MSKVDFKLDHNGVMDLMKSAEMQSVIQNYTERIANAAGDGFAGDVQVHNRTVGRVKAVTPHAYFSNLKHNTLLTALGGAKQ